MYIIMIIISIIDNNILAVPQVRDMASALRLEVDSRRRKAGYILYVTIIFGYILSC